MSTFGSRIDRLERQFRPRRVCPQCFDSPFRVAIIDGATDTVLRENFPETGCPSCGQPIYRELQIVGEADDDTCTNERITP